MLSVLYLLTLTPALLGTDTFLGQDLWAGITIAAVAFSELILSLVATIAGRHDTEPLASAVRRMNLASALVLISLAQAALVSARQPESVLTSTLAAAGFGVAAAVVGAEMLWRTRQTRPTRPTAHPHGMPWTFERRCRMMSR
ncbi:hypothetical protein ACFWN7_05645 [Agromyces sp. NPDC058484]|uniref:hypothetical protein n=1 Tax=Agromyces sp. NPDC058484 TaxID=3346524 RepID=UPI00365245C6